MLTLIKMTLFSLILLLSLSGCGQEPDSSGSNQASDENEPDQTLRQADNQPDGVPGSIPNRLQSWHQIKQSGVIRALKLAWEQENSLPRSGSTSLYHLELFSQFAAQHDLRVEWIKVNDLNQMFDYLAQFKADVIPRHLTITQNRLHKMSFTQPLLQDHEVLVARKGTSRPSPDEVINVSVPANTAYIDSLNKHFPNWQIETLKGASNAEDIADLLVDNKIEYSVLDELSLNTLLSYRDDIVVLMKFPTSNKLAWAVSPQNADLLDQLNQFIAVHHVTQASRSSRKFDLDKLKQKNLTLRIITRNSPETYFLWRGQLMGFEYELMREFAKQQNLRLEIIVAENYQQMKSLLEHGMGDVISAGLSRIEQRKSELKFSLRYNLVSELLVAHRDSSVINSLQDLKGRSLSIRKSSAFWVTAQQLAIDYGVEVVAVDEEMATELLIAQVADKLIDLTIADSNLVSIEKRFRDNIVTPLILKENVPYAYAVRDNNPQLLNALNAFIKKEYRGTFYNVIKGKYFASGKRLKRYRQGRIMADSALSPYDDLVKLHAKKYQFDWRLITSQMFQESHFDPEARSAAGAMGLMQLLPRTAKEIGFTKLTQPNQSVAAGVQYLDWTRARFSSNTPLQEKLFFALASYNAGFGHVRDAQRLAKKMGLDHNRWFDNVEKAMLLLQKPQYYKQARFGYCRGSEPVNYVREIQQRYLSYVEIAL